MAWMRGQAGLDAAECEAFGAGRTGRSARPVLVATHTARKRGQPLDRTQQWALALAERKGHNTAAVALANKTARRLWAAEHHGTRFDPEHVSRREANAA